MSPLAELVRLRLDTLDTHPEYRVGTDAARAAVERAIVEDLDAAIEVRSWGEPARAAVVVSRCASELGYTMMRGRVELALDDPVAVAWVAEAFSELRKGLDATFELRLDSAHAPVLPGLRRCGLDARMTHLFGDPKVALARLDERPALDLDALGLDIARLEDPSHVEPIVELGRAIFTESPELAFTSPLLPVDDTLQKSIDEFFRRRLRNNQERADATDFVVLRAGRVIGHAGINPHLDDPLLGPRAGMTIMLHSSIRGRGVGTELYRSMSRRMVELEIGLMTGRTANPAVLHLADRMGRVVRGWQVEPSR